MSNHPIVHIELSAGDPKAAGEFYANLLGWQVEYDPNMDYVMFNPGKGPAGGFNKVSEQTPAGSIMLYIACDDIDGMLKKADELGGKTLVPKSEIPTVGWFGVFADPTGNAVGLYTPLQRD